MIDEKALTDTQNKYADEAGKYRDMSIRTIIERYESAKTIILHQLLQSDKMREDVAKAIWDWEHEGRNSQILDIEWSLLSGEYANQATAAIQAIIDKLEKDGVL